MVGVLQREMAWDDPGGPKYHGGTFGVAAGSVAVLKPPSAFAAGLLVRSLFRRGGLAPHNLAVVWLWRSEVVSQRPWAEVSGAGLASCSSSRQPVL